MCDHCNQHNHEHNHEQSVLSFDRRGQTRVAVVEQILSSNNALAAQNRAALDTAGVLGINVMAAPGAGKTSLILRTIEEVGSEVLMGIVEGDTAPVTLDADKILDAGMPAVQVNTGGQCHLDAVMLAAALPQLNLPALDLLIVENVGNLICPAAFALGTHLNVVVASVPEGDDKPYKYPNIYRGIDALILNKIDLLPFVEFDGGHFRQGIEILNPGVAYFPLSCRTGEGVSDWITWLQAQIDRSAVPAGVYCETLPQIADISWQVVLRSKQEWPARFRAASDMVFGAGAEMEI
jgi:hydrogenase nickel incorporation protein HypB